MAKSKKFRVFRNLLLAIFLVLLVAITIIACLLFSKTPKLDSISLQTSDTFVISKHMWSCLGKSNEKIYPMTRKTLIIKSHEVMSVVRGLLNANKIIAMLGLNNSVQSIDFDEKTQQIRYNGNEFVVTQLLTQPKLSLLVKSEVTGNVELTNNHLDLIISEIKIGRISMPKNLVKKLEVEAENKLNNNIDKLTKYIKNIKFGKNGDIAIVYSPYELRKVMENF